MPKTLLAVDDSATMRTVLEITFSGDDYRVITAENRAGALAKLSEQPEVIVIDTVLDSEDGYALAKEIRAKSASSFIVLLASRFHPYDAARGREVGADMSMDKPWDVQQFVDRLKAAIAAKAAAPADVPPPNPLTATSPSIQAPAPPAAAIPAPAPSQPRGVAGAVAAPGPIRTQTLHEAPAPAPSSYARPAPAAPPAAAPAPARAPDPIPISAPARVGAPASPAIPADFSSKLGQLGLSAAQVEGVLSLSRDVVERVVWEVVPQLAELLIKEEIARLTKDA